MDGFFKVGILRLEGAATGTTRSMLLVDEVVVVEQANSPTA